ncbi:hypothetical protein MKY91_03775 [Alkalicoccobacillus gibsonii]|uniref:Uncharacterized protein n=1 Tax=Alkalicoccobacillus gibsonii TaxID=79881 RepID=A0ABU9VEG1_9BACI
MKKFIVSVCMLSSLLFVGLQENSYLLNDYQNIQQTSGKGDVAT